MRTICDGVGPRVLLGLGLINLYANSVTADPVTRYVGSLGAHISPFTSWANAATDIQSAVDVAEAGDTVLVSNGVYATGTRLAPGGQLPNRVVVTNNILIASLAGPAETIIVGQGPNGTNAVRCAFVTNGVLRGFTLRGGYTRTSAVAMDSSGGGIYGGRIEDSQIFNCSGVESGGGAYNAELSNCLLANNTARSGGGAEQSTLSACVVISNYATYTGGGVRESTLFNCNVSSNRSDGDGGGVLYGTLIGCRLEGNVASNSGGGVAGGTLNDCVLEGNQAQFGGGAAWGTLHNSRLANNSADSRGGGASGSTLYNSYLFGNRAETGGGASYCELMNCTVTMNEATGWHGGGGVEVTILVNCIVLHNFGNGQPNVNGDDDIAYSCTDRLLYGPGNIADDPQLLSPSHLSSTSPCFGAGSPAYTNGVDIDGDPWRQLPSMGCDERPIGLQTGALRVKIVTPNTTFAEGWTQRFMADIEGPVTRTTWSFGDDNSARNQYVVPHAWTNAGMYNVVLTAYSDNYPNGVSATTQVTVISAQMSARYVRPPGPGGGTYPYDSWATAARSIQQAVDAQSVIGGRVWVTNGVYLGSSRMMPGHLVPNRLVLTNGAWVVSVNGPTKTTIVGGSPAAGTRGGIRGVYVGGLGGILEGFTISNGYANVVSFNTPNERGGGIFVAGDPPGHLITNCVIRNCTATNEGGGLFSGRAQSCVLVDNSANTGGGASRAALVDCLVISNQAVWQGGGLYDSDASGSRITQNRCDGDGGGLLVRDAGILDCVVSENQAKDDGGGLYVIGGGLVDRCHILGNTAEDNGGGLYIVYGGIARACLVNGNAAYYSGGGVHLRGGGILQGSTIVSNVALTGGGTYCREGVGLIENCIVWDNQTIDQSGNWNTDNGGETLRYCCTTPIMPGPGMISLDPHFVATSSHDYRLRQESPCIDKAGVVAGRNQDLAGTPRPLDGDGDGSAVEDIGAYEFAHPGVDGDKDGMSDADEVTAGTSPIDSVDYLRFVAPSVEDPIFMLAWPTVRARTYSVYATTNLLNVWGLVETLPGTGNLASYTPTNAAPTQYYTVGVTLD